MASLNSYILNSVQQEHNLYVRTEFILCIRKEAG